MSKVSVRLNSAAAKQLLTGDAVRRDLERRAAAIRDAANAGTSPDSMSNRPYESGADSGRTRARAYVATATPHGINDNAKHDKLRKSLVAGR